MAEDQRDTAGRTGSCLDLQQALALYGDRLLRSAYLLCGNETEAQDLVQETFLQALKSAHRFRGASAVYTWLYGILRNLCHRHLRKQKRFLFEENLILETPFEPSADTSPDEEFCSAKIAAALQKLSPGHREVIVLRYFETMKIHDIAAQTGMSPGTVKSRLHYAVRCLERLLPNELNLFTSKDTHDQAAK